MPKSKYALDVVMEKYIGRKKELIQIEEELKKLVFKINMGHFSVLNDRRKGDITAKEINDSPENINICRLFRKLFQLKQFELVWVYTSIPQAYTPCKTFQSLDKSYSVTSDGVDINKKLTIGTFVHTGLITHSKMNESEILAIILHEIGHNFYQSAFQILSRVNVTDIVGGAAEQATAKVIGQAVGLTLVDLLNYTKIIKTIQNVKGMVIDKLKLRKLVVTTEEIAIIIASLTPHTVLSMTKLLVGRGKLKNGWFNPTQVLFLYNVEKHADSFAVDYGYGPQLVTALNKLDRRDNDKIANIPILNWMLDFDKLLSDITFQTLSGYPTIHNRQTSALNRLREASKDPNMPKAIKEELNSQLEEMEGYYANYMSSDNVENKRRIFTWLYRSLINTVFKGNADMREFIYKLDKSHPLNDKW